jgi:Zn-dependent protease with chaperone function
MSVPQNGAHAAPGRFGPADRVSFLAEQRRRRRQTWRLSAICTVVVLVTGLPLSVVLTPAAYAVLLGTVRVTGLMAAMPPAGRELLRRNATLVPRLFEALGGNTHVPLSQAISGGLIVAAPGVVVSLALWLALRALFVRAGAGGILLALGARPPRSGDLGESRFVDVTGEMAIAAGVPPPRVLVLDEPAANAAALGSSPDTAAIVVTRGLLDILDRAEQEAVAGHLIGSVGNGDLRVAVTITSTFHSIALVLTSLEAVVGLSGTAWRELGSAARWAFARRNDATAAEAVSEMLSREITRQTDDGISGVLSDSKGGDPHGGLARAARRFPPLKLLLFPLYLPYLVVLFLRMEIFMLRAFVAGPLVMLVWRTRRYLADAMAVQLTRDPDSLSRALNRLATCPTTVPKAQWASHLFFVGAARGHRSATAADEGVAGDLGGFVGSHPAVAKRLERLAAMGSNRAEDGYRAQRRFGGHGFLAFCILGPLVLLGSCLMLAALGMVFVLAGTASLFFAGIAMALIARFML